MLIETTQSVAQFVVSFLVVCGISHLGFTYKRAQVKSTNGVSGDKLREDKLLRLCHVTKKVPQLQLLENQFQDSTTYDIESVYMLSMITNFEGASPETTKFEGESEFIDVEPPQNKSFFETEMNRKWRQSNNSFLYDFEVQSMARSMNGTYRSPVSTDDIVFLVLGAKKLRLRCLSAIGTWLIWAKHYFIVADESMSLPNEIVINSTDGSYVNAGERHWRSVLWLKEHKPELMKKKWFVLVDDDTWMNIPALCRYLRDFDPDWNVAVGEVDHNFFIPDRTFLQGGSGEVFSRTAFAKMAAILFSPGCRYNRHGDLSLWHCYKVAQTVLVQSDRFSHWSVPVEKILHYYALYPPNYVTKISFHHMKNHFVNMAITCDVAMTWGVAEPPECAVMREDPKKAFITKLPTLNNMGYTHFGYGFIMG